VGNVGRGDALAGNVEPVAQPDLQVGTHAVEHSPPAGPRPLLDPVGAERDVRPARQTHRARPVQQPVADPATR